MKKVLIGSSFLIIVLVVGFSLVTNVFANTSDAKKAEYKQRKHCNLTEEQKTEMKEKYQEKIDKWNSLTDEEKAELKSRKGHNKTKNGNNVQLHCEKINKSF